MASCFTKKVKAEEEHMSDKPKMDAQAATIMQLMEQRVSKTLFQRLCEVVYPFRAEAQRKMAACLWKFARYKIATSTSNPSVDVVLNCCYLLIGAERRLVKKPLRNKLAEAQLIELEKKKADNKGKKVDVRLSVENPCEKNGCGIEFRKCCRSCRNRCVEADGKSSCLTLGIYVGSSDLCPRWEVAPSFTLIGRKKGKIKSKKYLIWVMEQRLQEDKDIEVGLLGEEDCKTNEELHREFEEKYGSIYE